MKNAMGQHSRLKVHPHCLMFFVDETGHEDFADPKYPVFGLGGCAVMAGVIERDIKRPWREMKAAHFEGVDTPLHAADLRDATTTQMQAIGKFFRRHSFGRFAVTMTAKTNLPQELKPYDLMPNLLRKRWVEIAKRMQPNPVEFALLHEASQRGDPLIEKYFGPTVAHVEGQQITVHHGFMPKSSDEALEVADFIIQAAGRHALALANGKRGFGKDFRAVFQANPLWSSFIAVDSAQNI